MGNKFLRSMIRAKRKKNLKEKRATFKRASRIMNSSSSPVCAGCSIKMNHGHGESLDTWHVVSEVLPDKSTSGDITFYCPDCWSYYLNSRDRSR